MSATTRRVIIMTTALAVLLAAAAGARPLTVAGRVLSPAGEGLAGAEVTLRPLLAAYQLARRQLAGEPTPPAAARVRAAGDGSYELRVPEAGFWRLTVAHPAYLAARFDLSPLAADRRLPEVTLLPRSDLAVRLVDGRGRALAGVVVAGRGWSGAWRALARDGWWPEERRALAGEGGMAVMPCEVDEKVSLAALADGLWVHRVVPCDAGGAELVMDGELQPARLLAASGEPAAATFAFVRWPFLPVGKSGAAGRLRLPDAATVPVPLAFAEAAGSYGEGEAGWREGADGALLEVRLPPVVELTGRVVDAVSEAPLAGAWLWLGRGATHFHQTDGRGGFRWQIPAAGGELRVGAAGYVDAVTTAPAASGEPWTVRLLPALGRRGRVVDEAGDGIPGAEVRARLTRQRWVAGVDEHGMVRASGPRESEEVKVISDGEGAFELRPLVPWVGFELAVRRSGYARHTSRHATRAPGAAAEELLIELAAARIGFGRVVDQHEAPLAGAAVELIATLSGPSAEALRGTATSHRATSDGDGRFILQHLAAGTYYLAARAPGHPEVLVPGIEIAPGEGPLDLGTVLLAPGIRLRGRVVDPAGRGVEGARLSVRAADSGQATVQRPGSLWFAAATSGTGGGFQLDALPPESRLALAVFAEGFLHELVGWTTGSEAEELTVELRRGSRLRGLVVGPAGRPVAGAVVELAGSGPGGPLVSAATWSRRAVTDADGRFELRDLPPGDYAIHAHAAAGASDPVRRRFAAAEAALEVVLELRVKAAVAGWVLDPQGAPVEGARVFAMPEGDAAAGRSWAMDRRLAQTGASGRFEIGGLEAGRARLRASHESFEPTSIEVELAEAAPRTVELRFVRRIDPQRRALVTGRVVDGAGLPVSGARLRLGRREVRSGPAGEVELTVPVGSHPLSCRHAGYAPYFGGPLAVGEEGVSDLIVELSAGATIAGRVSGLDFADLARLEVVAWGEHDQLYGSVSFDGALRIPRVPPGEWTVRARLGNPTRSASAAVSVARGDSEAWVELTFESGYRLAGRVLAGGIAVPRVTVGLRCEGDFRGEAFTDADGGFAFDDVPAAACTLGAADSRRGSARRQLVMTGDLDVVLEIGPAPPQP